MKSFQIGEFSIGVVRRPGCRGVFLVNYGFRHISVRVWESTWLYVIFPWRRDMTDERE